MLLVRLVLVTMVFVVVVVLGDTTKSSSQVRQEIASKDTSSIDKDEASEHRQGRMALHTEAPVSKAKREQTFRNILAAKRRKILGSRRQEIPTSSSLLLTRKTTNNKSLVVVNGGKESLDMLEAEETRHGIFITGPAGDEPPAAIIDDNDAESSSSSITEKIIKISNETNDNNNTRKKNTFIMPESLYKHFHPVESNIPVEDMTQFLYFGQKIQPEISSNNNHTNEVTLPPATNQLSRRSSRFTTKRLAPPSASATTISTTKYEDLINNEMNIGIERNNLQKIKSNNYRSNSLNNRKPLSSTISSNIIIDNNNNKSIETIGESLIKNEETKLSAHANQMLSDDNPSEGSKIHRSNIIRDSTDIPDQVNATESENLNNQMLNSTINKNDKLFIRNKKSEFYTINDENMKKNNEEKKIQETTTQSEESRTRLSTWMSVDPVTSSTSDSSSQVVDTFNELALPSSISTTTTTNTFNQHHSSLRIVVTEQPMPATSSSSSSLSFSTSSDIAKSPKDTVTTGNRSTLLQTNKKDPASLFSSSSSISSSSSSSSSSSINSQQQEKEKEQQSSSSINNKTTTAEFLNNNNKSDDNVSSSSPVGSIQQMHPYAYTITNITRLLRNYSGAGSVDTMTTTTEINNVTFETTMTTLTSSKEEEEEEEATIKTAAAETTTTTRTTTTKDAELLPPLSIEIGSIDSMRESVGASAESTGVQTSSSVLQNQLLNKKIPHHLPILSSRNESFKNSTTTTENYNTITGLNGMEFDTSTVRWNYTSDNNGDRRYLKKSASAVLNQRTSEENIREYKRTRVIDTSFTTNRRIKNTSRTQELLLSMNNNNNDKLNNSTVIKMSENNVMEKIDDSQTTLLPDVVTSINDEFIGTSSDDVNVNDGVEINNNNNKDDSSIKTSSVSVNLNNNNNNFNESSLLSEVRVRSDYSRNNNNLTIDSNDSIKNDDAIELSKIETTTRDLEPAEIQKMYRSQTTLRPEPPITTLPPDILTSTQQPEIITTTTEVVAATTKSSERSPDVRGRNLSDKTKDKDDILPIMHLYNTSNIFNASIMIPDDKNNKNYDNNNLPPLTTLSSPSEITNLPTTTSSTTTTTATTTTTTTMKNTSTMVNETKDGSIRPGTNSRANKNRQDTSNKQFTLDFNNNNTTRQQNSTNNKTKLRPVYFNQGTPEYSGYHPELNESYYEPGMITIGSREPINISEVITKRHDVDAFTTQETVTFISYILATLVVFPIAIGVGLILRRLIIKNRKVLEESDTSSEISCRKDALNLENGDFKTSIEKAITKLPRIQHLCHEVEKPPPSPQSQESRWEFSRDKLRLQTVLGQGNFGQVWKAEADDLTGHQGTTRLVAVKTVKEGASAREKEDLVRELEIMQQLGNHPNVVTLLGCCTEEEPHYLILEYVMYGKLLAYLRDHRTRQDFYNFSEDSAALTSRDLTVFGYCVARGMEYLASKKIIHRDLAARNVLVDHNKLCKIADFGMSRLANEDGECIETRHGRNALPIRWMAPESLIYSLFTTKTDVWSFGILMWEIVTLGSTPYPDMAAREVMRNVQNGYRLERPSHCRSELFRVIARCWHADPDRRPEFQTLRRDLAQLLEDNMNGHYVDLESFASECTD